MTAFVFSIGLFNLGLGALVALWLERPAAGLGHAVPWRTWSHRLRRLLISRRRNAAREKASPVPPSNAEAVGRPPSPITPDGASGSPPLAGIGAASVAVAPAAQPSTTASSYQQGAQILDRAGFDAMIDDWLKRDSERLRIVSGILVEVDRFNELSEQYGNGTREQFISAFTLLMERLIRKDRGFDRVVRFQGDLILLFLGDTALRNAMNAAERIRQTISATTFHFGGQQASITASCAVTEWRAAETFEQWTVRLQDVLGQAIGAGGNRCHVEDERGAYLLTARPYMVPKHEISVTPSKPA